MPSSSLSERKPEWMPNGFPPRSFPPGGALPPPEGPPPVRTPKGGGRGRWLAAAAAFLAVLLLLVGLLVARSGDDGGDDLAAGTSTSALDATVPSFDVGSTTLAPPPSIEPVATTVGAVGATTTPATGGVVPAGDPALPAPVLEPSLTLLALPKADATSGAARGTLTLRNSGGSPVTYTITSSAPGLSAAPTRGFLTPGGAATITVTLDGTRVEAEGPFKGTLTFSGAPAVKAVQVQSVVGRPPTITDGVGESCQTSTRCSRQIKLAPSSDPSPSPCNTPWLYSVLITDQSKIQMSRAIARRGMANADAQLRRGGTSDIFQSEAFAPLPAGTILRFAIEAVDEFGFGRRLAEQTIAC